MEEQPIKQEHSNLTIKELFFKYVRFLPLFLLSVALALLVAFAYLRYATQIYSATGSLLIKSETTEARPDKVEDILMGGNRGQNLQSEIEILKSKPLMTRVVNKLDLQFTYTTIGKIKGLNVYRNAPFIVRASQLVDSTKSFTLKITFTSNNQFKVDDESAPISFGQSFKNERGIFSLEKSGDPVVGSEFSVSYNSPERQAASLVRGLSVQPRTAGTGILNISMQTTNARMAADIVNVLMVQYDSMTVEQNNFSTDQMLNFIDGRLDKLKSELDSIQGIELALRQRENLFDVNIQSGAYFDKLKEVDALVREYEIRIDLVNNVESYVKTKENQFTRVVPSSLGLEDLTLNELVNGYNKAQMERQMLLDAHIPPSNPSVKEAEGVIEKQRQNLLESLQNLRASYLDAIASLKRKSGIDLGRLESMPAKIKELVEIERQISTKLALYSLLEGKREEAAISRAATISNSAIVDKANPSNTPIKPNRRTIQLMAIIIGLALPAIGIFIKEAFNDKVTTRADIEKVTNAPIIGEVGHSFSDDVLVVTKSSRSMVAEQFRIIRSNLQYVVHNTEKLVILVTSTFSGEGKSFVSTNMGAVLALTGKKTIILEFDIRKPKVISGLKMQKGSGISNFLVRNANLDELILPVPGNENLYVLPCGPVPPNPSELLLDSRVDVLFEELRKRFDIIIIDTAPVGMVSDAQTLGKYADCTLYLVRQERTFKKQVVLIDEIYEQKKLPKVSIVVNDVKLRAGYGYYGYGRYGYGYGYGEKSDYFKEEAPPRGFWDKLLDSLDVRNLFKKKKRK